MSHPPALDLLRFLIADHSVDRGSASVLIPCLHESIEEDVDFLTAGARRCGGTTFNLNAQDDHWELPPGPLSAERLALVEGILASASEMLPSKVVIESTPSDDIVARLEDPDLVPEPSLVPVLRAAALIASAAYENFRLVVTTVDVSALDANRRELLWSLLTLDPADLRIAGEPTTIVPVIGKLVDPDIDYRRTPAIRYVVRWDRVLRRATQTDARSIQLFAKPSTEPIVLFLGAGASASSGLRLGNHYRDRALKDLVGEQESSERAAEDFFDLLHERDHLQAGDGDSRAAFARDLTLERVLQEVFLELGYRPRTDAAVIQDIIADSESALQWLRSGRKAIRDLARMLRGRLVLVTVNFDQLIETDLGLPTRVHYRPEDFRDFRAELAAYLDGDDEAPVPVLKIHGSIDDPSSIIATIDRTSAGLHDEVRETLNALLGRANSPLRWIWVGCSMRDRDVNLWLGGLAANALDEYWVDPLPGAPLDAFVESHRSSRWRALGLSLSDRLIIDSADGFLSAFARQVEEFS